MFDTGATRDADYLFRGVRKANKAGSRNYNHLNFGIPAVQKTQANKAGTGNYVNFDISGIQKRLDDYRNNHRNTVISQLLEAGCNDHTAQYLAEVSEYNIRLAMDLAKGQCPGAKFRANRYYQ